MARLPGALELPAVTSDRLTDRISLGVLARIVPRDLVDEVLAETRRLEQRKRLLPARVVVYFTMAMCLFFDDDYDEVMRRLVGTLRWLGSWKGDWKVPSTGAISQARTRLGPEPLKLLFERVAVPVAGLGTKGAWLGSRRLVAVDGVHLDTADTPENADAFGRFSHGPKTAAFPQVHVVALAECGTHAVFAAAIGAYTSDERSLAATLFDACEPGMLLTADRNFYGYGLWQQALATGADLLWRVNANLTLPVIRALPDGSYLSLLIDPKIPVARRGQLIADARAGHAPPTESALPVRVIEYSVPDHEENGTSELICLITNILDPTDVAAIELATSYHERWEIESTFDEIKTHQRGEKRVLRSKNPELVKQEIWALLLTHYAIRSLMIEAADEADIDPDRLSFMRTLRITRRQVTDQADFSP
ncbi:transposase IS4 family protein [Parafrankia sp. EAN1pec]|uniref:IS4-like element ISFsp5 family transposase n=1 Tax=Parafrankia sp. (strain EAN1pec) TaxID=298653 RepID=UPI00005402EE|nr:transposase IS4 family protein [Frankia sp. EAN1pec]ABW14887.1 transposase IS4 family protein [Frankia sp. EAN1pec]